MDGGVVRGGVRCAITNGVLISAPVVVFFFFKQKTAYEMSASLVGSEMCIRDRTTRVSTAASPWNHACGSCARHMATVPP